MTQTTTVAERISDLWAKAWVRELGPDATLTGVEQGKLYMLVQQAKAEALTRVNLEKDSLK
ncbi:MAG: hypothetical protein JKY52_08350 [Flavobacteriales bacterium]|nr:hypothetical protein [Flavobacteriales bacterium]